MPAWSARAEREVTLVERAVLHQERAEPLAVAVLALLLQQRALEVVGVHELVLEEQLPDALRSVRGAAVRRDRPGTNSLDLGDVVDHDLAGLIPPAPSPHCHE